MSRLRWPNSRHSLSDVPGTVHYRNDLASSHTRSVGDAFIAVWEHFVEVLHEVAAEYDAQWRVRKRIIDSMMLMLLIFRLVSSKNSQGYGTTIDASGTAVTD